jgi:hypothetical protein
MIAGIIPKALNVYFRSKDKHRLWVDGKIVDGVYGHYAFAADETNAKTNASAEEWAKRRENDSYGGMARLENTPFETIELVSLVHRGNGGRAYKVRVHDKYIFDFREDVLMSCMLNSVISRGKITGPFIFATVNSEMKIIQVDSELYRNCQETTEFGSLQPIKNFEVGGVYKNKTSTSLYLGQVYIPDIEFLQQNRQFSYRYETKGQIVKWDNGYSKVHLFYELNLPLQDTPFEADRYGAYYYASFIKSPPRSYKKKIHQYEGTQEHLLEGFKKYVLESRMKNNRSIFSRDGVGSDYKVYLGYDMTDQLGKILNCSLLSGAPLHPLFLENTEYVK